MESPPDASVAQLVEQRIENPRVGGSNPPRGTTSQLVHALHAFSANDFVWPIGNKKGGRARPDRHLLTYFVA
jgi:hypothetical protein